jgi:hypothetical protein
MKDKFKKFCLSIIGIIIIIIIAIFIIKKKTTSATSEYKVPSIAYPVEILNAVTEEDNIDTEENIIDDENIIDIEREKQEF